MTATVTRSPKLNDEKYADVLDATRLWVTDYLAEHGMVESLPATWGVAAQFGHDCMTWPGEKFGGQVLRALNALVADGTLVKVPRGRRTPGGGYTGQHPAFYTPESFAEAERRAAQRAAEERAERERWVRVSALLRENGFEHTDGTFGNGNVLLSASLDAWEGLAARLAALDVMRP